MVLKKHIVETMDLDISDKTRFPNSNKMYEAVLVDMKKKGLGVVDHKPPITQDDLKKLYSSDTPVFNVNSAAGLQSKVWFEIMFYLCRRGQENLREMKKSTFAVATEGERRYVTFTKL